MSRFVADLGNMTITSGQTASNAVTSCDDADTIVVYAPAALTGTVTIQIEPTLTGTSFVDLQSGGTDVTIGAGNSTSITSVGFRQLRGSSNAAEGADRVFPVTKQFPVR